MPTIVIQTDSVNRLKPI